MGRVLGTIFGACALLFASCASPKITAAQKASLRRVGVVSIMGDEVHGAFRGTTAFGNREHADIAPDFAIDQVAEQAATRRLASAGIQARPLPSARATLKQNPPPASYGLDVAFTKEKEARASALVRQICAANNVDGLAIIKPGVFGPNDLTPVRMEGVGRSGANVFGMKSHGVFTILNVLVYDRAGTRLTIGGSWPGGEQIEEFGWRERLADYPPAERAVIREKIQAALDKNVSGQLERVGL